MLRRVIVLVVTFILVYVPLSQAASVHLSWTAATTSGSPVTSYSIKHGTVSGTHGTTVVVGLQTTGSIAGLTLGQTYYFVVTATNAEGESAKSTELPVLVTIPSLDDGSIRLSIAPVPASERTLTDRTYTANPTTRQILQGMP